MKEQEIRRTSLGAKLCRAAALTAGLAALAAGAAWLYGAATATRQRAAFRSVVAAHRDDPVAGSFERKAALMDEVERTVLAAIARAEAGKASPLSESSAADDRMNALELFVKYSDPAAAPPAGAQLSPEESGILSRYCRAKASLVEKRIAERGRIAAKAPSADAAEVVALCMVTPLVAVGDEEWSSERVDRLPKWIKQPQYLDHAEMFALTARRPLTAYQLALYRSRTGAAPAPGRTAYLIDASEKLVRIGDFQDGIHCLRTAILLAHRSLNNDDEVGARVQLASLMAELGQPASAAEELAPLLEDGYRDGDWARAAPLRLVYLVKASECAKAIEEARRYRSDARAALCMPELYYLEWQACCRQDSTDEARRVQKEFLALFPKHRLAADVYFAAAMDRIQEGDYGNAQVLLETVATTFPDSRVTPRAKEIAEKLKAAANRK